MFDLLLQIRYTMPDLSGLRPKNTRCGSAADDRSATTYHSEDPISIRAEETDRSGIVIDRQTSAQQLFVRLLRPCLWGLL